MSHNIYKVFFETSKHFLKQNREELMFKTYIQNLHSNFIFKIYIQNLHSDARVVTQAMDSGEQS